MEGFCLEILGDAAVKKVDKVLSSDTLTAWHIKGWVNAMENQVKTNKANKIFFTLTTILLCTCDLNMMAILPSANVVQSFSLIWE